jgi:hypothetical protein
VPNLALRADLWRHVREESGKLGLYLPALVLPGRHACFLDHSAQREWGASLACSPANSQSRAAGAFCNAYRRNGLSPLAGLDDTASRRRSLALPQLLIERESLLPVVLHTDDRPALRLRHVAI